MNSLHSPWAGGRERGSGGRPLGTSPYTVPDPSVVAQTPGLAFPKSMAFQNEAGKPLWQMALQAGWPHACAYELGLAAAMMHSSRAQTLSSCL